MGLLSSFTKASGKSVGTATLNFMANRFPDLTDNAAIESYREDVEKLATIVGRLTVRLADDTRARDAKKADFERLRNALKLMSDKGQNIDAELPRAEKMKAELAEAEATVTQTEQDLDAAKDDHQKRAQHLQEAVKAQETRKREAERLDSDIARQKARATEAQSRAGLTSKLDPSAAIQAATDARMKKKREALEAARADADVFTSVGKSSESSPELAAALAEVDKSASPAKNSSERLSSLFDE